MKQIFLSFIMLLCVGSAFGQTVDKLMAKWKTIEGAEYSETTEETRKSIEESREKGSAGLSKEDYDFVMKNLKKVEQIQMTLDEDQMAQLANDLQALKGYETLFMQNDNKEPEEGKNMIQNMINQTFNANYQMRFYGRVKGNIVNDLLIRWDIWGKVVLAHLDGKIKKDLMLKSIIGSDWGDFVSIEEDEDAVNMKDVVKEVEDGNALIVINGDEHPELRSLDEAKDYMEKNNFHFNHESWVVGGAVKEKYPNTDKKVVIEFSRQEKEQK
jgi:hypothetical protein